MVQILQRRVPRDVLARGGRRGQVNREIWSKSQAHRSATPARRLGGGAGLLPAFHLAPDHARPPYRTAARRPAGCGCAAYSPTLSCARKRWWPNSSCWKRNSCHLLLPRRPPGHRAASGGCRTDAVSWGDDPPLPADLVHHPGVGGEDLVPGRLLGPVGHVGAGVDARLAAPGPLRQRPPGRSSPADRIARARPPMIVERQGEAELGPPGISQLGAAADGHPDGSGVLNRPRVGPP